LGRAQVYTGNIPGKAAIIKPVFFFTVNLYFPENRLAVIREDRPLTR
jgi:hypothetical protein